MSVCRPFKPLRPPTLVPTCQSISAFITLTNPSLSSMNERRYGRSSQGSLKIPSGNLQQSLHLAPRPSATLTFPSVLTAPSPLFPAPPTPTPILTLKTTSTTPTSTLSPLSHPSYPPNHHARKRQKHLLAPHPQPHHNELNHHVHEHARTCHLDQENTLQKDKTIHPDHHLKEKPTHPQSVHFHQFQAKVTLKNPLPFTHHRTSLTTCLTTHPTTSSTPSTTSTTKTPPNTKISTTTVKSTSTAPIHNTPNTPTTPIHDTPTTITNTTISTATINTTTPIASINATTTTTAIPTTATQTKNHR